MPRTMCCSRHHRGSPTLPARSPQAPRTAPGESPPTRRKGRVNTTDFAVREEAPVHVAGWPGQEAIRCEVFRTLGGALGWTVTLHPTAGVWQETQSYSDPPSAVATASTPIFSWTERPSFPILLGGGGVRLGPPNGMTVDLRPPGLGHAVGCLQMMSLFLGLG